MKFSELVRLLEKNGFRIIKEKGFDLEEFSGTGHLIKDCIYNAKLGILEHVDLLLLQDLPVPSKNPDPQIIIQNNRSLVAA